MKSLILLVLSLVSVQCLVPKDWIYSIESISSKVDKPDVLEVNLRPKRIERGKYGLSGTFVLKVDLGDDVQVDVKAYRSEKGNSDYKLLPFRIPEANFYSFMSDVYIKLGVMESFKKCSNMVQIGDDKWTNPYPAGTYELNECLVSTEPFPDHMQPGYYKVVLAAHSDAFNFSLDVIVKVDRAF